MNQIGITIIDEAIGRIKWMDLAAYRNFLCRFGARKARILRDYIIFPIFGLQTVNQLKGKTAYSHKEIYELLQLKFHWQKLIQQVAREILKEFYLQREKLPAERKIRAKIMFSTDDTYDEKTGKNMEGSSVIKDHHDGAMKTLYNPVVLYCTIDWFGDIFSFPLDLEVWQQKSKSKKVAKIVTHKKRWEYAKDMIVSLLDYCAKNNISLHETEFSADGAYCVQEIFALFVEPGIRFVTRPRSTHSFVIDDQVDNLRWHANNIENNQWKRSQNLNIRYYKKKAFHKKFGDCTVLFYEQLTKGHAVIRFLVANQESIRVDSLFYIFKKDGISKFFFAT